ncbi:MAG: type II secretion system protein GspC [Gammaproteobacteria bacterium]|nr:type II secretion system protein GspC [Gammaproteobacteria bacterium]
MANPLITQLSNPAVLLQINQRAAAIVSLLLIVACAYLLVEITWLFFPQEEEQSLPVQKQTGSTNKTQAQQNNFKNLTAANIFGVSETATVQKQTKVPETRLNLTLKGVLAAEPMNQASAIIAQGKSGKEDIYGIGDKIPGGVVIKEIHADYVVLERNGQAEILNLQKISGLTDIESEIKPAWQSQQSPGAALQEIRENILKNPASFADYALPVVVKEKGRQIGYRLQPQKKGDVLSRLGIQSTDVITKINGRRLNRPQNGIAALRSLTTAKQVNIVVNRDGTEVPLNITLQ